MNIVQALAVVSVLFAGAGVTVDLAPIAAALEAGETERAVTLAERAVEADRNVAEHHFLLGVALAANIESVSALGKLRAARRMRAAWERTVELDPSHMRARSTLVTFYAQAPRIVGGGRDKALAQLEEIRRHDPLLGHRVTALLHQIDDEPQAALIELDRAVELAHDDLEKRSELHSERGFLCQELEDWSCAHNAFTLALDDDPENWRALYQIGRTAVFSGERADVGIAALQRYLGHQPTGAEPSLAWAHVRLGTLFEMMDDAESARGAYKAALALDPEHAEAAKALKTLGVGAAPSRRD